MSSYTEMDVNAFRVTQNEWEDPRGVRLGRSDDKWMQKLNCVRWKARDAQGGVR